MKKLFMVKFIKNRSCMGTISINEMRIKLPDDKEVTYPQVIEWLNYVLGRKIGRAHV